MTRQREDLRGLPLDWLERFDPCRTSSGLANPIRIYTWASLPRSQPSSRSRLTQDFTCQYYYTLATSLPCTLVYHYSGLNFIFHLHYFSHHNAPYLFRVRQVQHSTSIFACVQQPPGDNLQRLLSSVLLSGKADLQPTHWLSRLNLRRLPTGGAGRSPWLATIP